VKKCIKRNDYYPFGLSFNSYQRPAETPQKYKYNGKELQTDLNLDWYDYGARMYDAAIGRFFTQDRFAEKYYGLTSYNYTANNPIGMVDINGDSIIVKVIQGGGKKGRDLYQIKVTGKVVDDTKDGLSAKKLNKIAKKISRQIRKSFKGKDKNIEFETTTDISVADEDNPLQVGDHAFRVVDDVATTIGETDPENGNIAGFALPGQNVVYIEKGVIYGRTGAHELGHSATLAHPQDEINPATGTKYTTKELNTQFRGNLMHQSINPASGTRINANQVKKIKEMYSIGALNRGKQQK
jgi:RHS repeat-associated protein